MGALLHDFAVPHHQDQIRLADGRQAVGNEEGGAVLQQVVDGLLDELDITRLKELRALLDKEFGTPLKAKVEKIDGKYPTQPVYLVTLDKPVPRVKYVELREDISKGQRVESFRIEYAGGGDYPLFQGTTIGNRKICALTDPFAEQNRLLDDTGDQVEQIVVRVTAARGEVFIKNIDLF